MTVKRVETNRADYHQVYGYSNDPTQETATYNVPLDSNRLCGFKNDYGEGKIFEMFALVQYYKDALETNQKRKSKHQQQ